MWGVAGLEEELTLWRGVGTRLDDGSVGRGEGFVRSAGVGKGRLGQRGGKRREPKEASQASHSDCSLASSLLSRPVCGPVEKLSQVPGLWVSLHDLRGFL